MIYLLLALAALFALICWNNLRHGVMIFVATLPAYVLRAEVFTIPTTLLELMLLVLLITFLFQQKNHLKQFFALKRAWLFPIILLFLSACLGIIAATDTASALGIFKAYFLEPIIFFFLVMTLLRQKVVRREDLLRALGYSALFVSGVGLYQWATGTGIPIPWDIERRITSVFPYPNAVGLYLGPIVVLAITQIKRAEYFWKLVALLGSLAILFAESEAAIVAVLATTFVWGVSRPSLRRVTLAITAGILIIIALSSARPYVIEKLTLQDYSGQVRLSQWSETITMLKTRPWFGAGLSGYPEALIPFHNATHYEIFQYPHNIFLNIWTELGILGLFVFVWLGYQFMAEGFWRFGPSGWALVVMFIHGLVDVPYFKNDLALLTWLLLALFIYASQSPRKKQA